MAKQQPKTEQSVISVLLPTRGRREVLRKSLKSLVSKASHPERLEILFGVDEDDQSVIDFIKEEIAEDLKEVGIEARASIFKPSKIITPPDFAGVTRFARPMPPP